MATGEKKKKKAGSKSKLTAENAEKAFEMAREGFLDFQIAQVIGIHPQNFTTWKTTYAEFAEALKEAREKPIALVEAALFRSAVGYTHDSEIVSFSKSGRVRRAKIVKHYAPNPAAISMYLKAHAPQKYRETLQLVPPAPVTGKVEKKTFKQFCLDAGYPSPFAKQEEMRAFGMTEVEPRIILGSRGYGKTDYVTMLGTAYELYEDWFDSALAGKPPTATTLIVTKSQGRNAAILDEISKACEKNGMAFEKKNTTCLRVAGLHGKDHSVEALTIGAKSVRGRHPKRIIMDDPVTEDDDSEATRKRAQKLYNELMKLTDNILIIGQPVHKFDLYETLRPMILKMEVPYGSIPELDPDLEAQRLAGVSEASIQASYFLKVISESGFPLEKVKYLDEFGGGPSVAFIDPSFEGGDYTALSIVKGHFDGVAVQGHVFKKAWYDCIDEMVARMAECGVKRICFETNSLGDQPVVMLRDVVPDGIGVVGKKSTGHKHSRIIAAGAYASQIHLAKTSDRIYLEQVTKYEYGAKNDDAPDSLASALEWIGLIRGKQNV